MKLNNFTITLYKSYYQIFPKNDNYFSKFKDEFGYFISGSSPLKYRSPVKDLKETSNAERIERNFKFKQIISQYKLLTKDNDIRKKHNKHFFLFSNRRELNEEKKDNNIKIKKIQKKDNENYHFSYTPSHKIEKSKSTFYYFPLINNNNNIEINNRNNDLLNSMKFSENNFRTNKFLLMKKYNRSNFFIDKKRISLSPNFDRKTVSTDKNKIIKISDIEKLVNHFKNTKNHSEEHFNA